ncbi:MAG: PIN domain-containing protein [Candidatus Thermoplasmatota archaeon]
MAEFLMDTSGWVDVTVGRHSLPSQLASDTMVVCTLAVAELASIAEQGRVPRAWVDLMMSESRIEECLFADQVEGGLLHGRLRKAGNRKVSIADCIMYCVARRLGVPFLMSDRDLQGHPGVIVL